MKTYRLGLVLLAASASLAVSAEPSQPDNNVLRHDETTFKTADLDRASKYLSEPVSEPKAAGQFHVAGPLVDLFRTPRRTLQWINPMAPAGFGDLREQAPVSRAFSDPVKHEAGLVLFRASR